MKYAILIRGQHEINLAREFVRIATTACLENDDVEPPEFTQSLDYLGGKILAELEAYPLLEAIAEDAARYYSRLDKRALSRAASNIHAALKEKRLNVEYLRSFASGVNFPK